MRYSAFKPWCRTDVENITFLCWCCSFHTWFYNLYRYDMIDTLTHRSTFLWLRSCSSNSFNWFVYCSQNCATQLFSHVWTVLATNLFWSYSLLPTNPVTWFMHTHMQCQCPHAHTYAHWYVYTQTIHPNMHASINPLMHTAAYLPIQSYSDIHESFGPTHRHSFKKKKKNTHTHTHTRTHLYDRSLLLYDGLRLNQSCKATEKRWVCNR